MTSVLPSAALFVWAGVAIGGNMIAAPAKFSVGSLDLPMALLVGRAQFLWIGYAEAMLAFAALGLAFIARGNVWLVLLPTFLLGVQWLVMMPLLNARSDLIIAGSTPPSSMLHVAFIGIEFAKVLALLSVGYLACRHGATNMSVAQQPYFFLD